MGTPRSKAWRQGMGTSVETIHAEGTRERVDTDALLLVLADLLALKQGALRDLMQARKVANDALQPLAGNRPVSGPAQHALVTIALMSLGQASDALEELEVVVKESGVVNITRQEPVQ